VCVCVWMWAGAVLLFVRPSPSPRTSEERICERQCATIWHSLPPSVLLARAHWCLFVSLSISVCKESEHCSDFDTAQHHCISINTRKSAHTLIHSPVHLWCNVDLELRILTMKWFPSAWHLLPSAILFSTLRGLRPNLIFVLGQLVISQSHQVVVGCESAMALGRTNFFVTVREDQCFSIKSDNEKRGNHSAAWPTCGFPSAWNLFAQESALSPLMLSQMFFNTIWFVCKLGGYRSDESRAFSAVSLDSLERFYLSQSHIRYGLQGPRRRKSRLTDSGLLTGCCPKHCQRVNQTPDLR